MVEREFNPTRLVDVRHRRGLTQRALCGMTGLSTKSLSDFETGRAFPSPTSIGRLAEALAVPTGYFLREDAPTVSAEAVSFRARTKMTQRQRDASLSALRLGIELRRWLDVHYQLPKPDLPTLELHSGELRRVESAAEIVRAKWGLGETPLGNMIHLLELHGVNVFSLRGFAAEVDAFSYWYEGTAFIFLNPLKSGERGRFDAAHELGHLVLHRDLSTPVSREQEREADRFAAAFLMPEADVRASVRAGVDLTEILQLKVRWGVAAMALTHRVHELDLFSDWQYRNTCVNLSRLGYRSSEPNGMQRESSQLLAQVFTDLRRHPHGLQKILAEMEMTSDDLNDQVFGLVPTGLRGAGQQIAARTVTSAPGLRLVDG